MLLVYAMDSVGAWAISVNLFSTKRIARRTRKYTESCSYITGSEDRGPTARTQPPTNDGKARRNI